MSLDSLARTSRPAPPEVDLGAWPLVVDRDPGAEIAGDGWAATVVRAIHGLRAGGRQPDVWADDASWIVRAAGHADRLGAPDGVRDHHAALRDASGGTFRQRLVSLEPSQSPIVSVYVRTVATRGDARLDQPALLVFEVAHGRVRRVTELPGDPVAWCRFWGC